VHAETAHIGAGRLYGRAANLHAAADDASERLSGHRLERKQQKAESEGE